MRKEKAWNISQHDRDNESRSHKEVVKPSDDVTFYDLGSRSRGLINSIVFKLKQLLYTALKFGIMCICAPKTFRFDIYI